MGSDIIMYLEIKKDNKWEFISKPDLPRAYNTFAILSGNRNYLKPNFKPIAKKIGIDKEMSKFVKKSLDRWDEIWANVATQKMIEEYDWDKEVLDTRESDKIKLFKLSELIPAKYEVLFQKMKELAKEYGNENVRIIFWYDS